MTGQVGFSLILLAFGGSSDKQLDLCILGTGVMTQIVLSTDRVI